MPRVCGDLGSLVGESIAFYQKQKMSKLLIEKEQRCRNGGKTSKREINADSSSYGEEDQAEEIASANCSEAEETQESGCYKRTTSFHS